MEKLEILVREWGGRPIRRFAISAIPGVIYVASTHESDVSPPPIGVPASDVFAVNEATFSRLCSEWKENGRTSDSVWKTLTAFDASNMIEA